jgi:hypothetical protein
LQRRRADFFLCRRRLEIVESLNISTHSICYQPPIVFKDNYNASPHCSANETNACLRGGANDEFPTDTP